MTIKISGRSIGGTTITTRLLKAIIDMPPQSSTILVQVSAGDMHEAVKQHVLDALDFINNFMIHTHGRSCVELYRIKFI